MPTVTVNRGDSIPSLAHDNGHFWETLWNHGDNAALKALRKTPNILMPGDEVFVPEIRLKEVHKGTDSTHKFVRRGVPAKIRIQLMMLGEPRKNEKYTLVIDGVSTEGTADGQGIVEAFITPNAKGGKLILVSTGEEIPVELGHLNPIDTVSGVRQRLSNLGFECTDGEELDDQAQSAIRLFQAAQGLEKTGKIDSTTRSRIHELHP